MNLHNSADQKTSSLQNMHQTLILPNPFCHGCLRIFDPAYNILYQRFLHAFIDIFKKYYFIARSSLQKMDATPACIAMFLLQKT